MSEEYNIAEVELLGHKAKVSCITGRLADILWPKEDCLAVWLNFDEPVDGTQSFGIDLPAKSYSKTEFLGLVVKKGEARLQELIGNHAREIEQMKGRESRQKALDDLARVIEAEVTK